MKSKFLLTFVLAALVIIVSACSAMIPVTAPTAASGDQSATQQAQIVEAARSTATTIAMQREIANLQTQVAQGSQQPIVVTATPLPPTATATAAATATATAVPPTATPILPTATSTATPIPCNAAQFVSDVTISDGSVLSPNSSFTKTWRLKNTGSCTWTTSYDVVFVSGSQMSGPSAVDLPGSVAPGQVIDVSVNLVAPNKEGSFRGDWKLRDAAGVLFGLGRSGASFYVDIKVRTPHSDYPYDFIASMCMADWTSGAGKLPCGGGSSASGYVQRIDNPTLETGNVDDESALLTYPQMVTDGVIRGKYPSVRVESGYHFESLIGCGHNLDHCDVNFQLDYQIGDGTIKTLKTWHEVYDERVGDFDVDLSGLAGNDVRFILTVFANGSPSQDQALWLAPRIVKK